MAIFREDPVTGEVIRFEDGTTEEQIQERFNAVQSEAMSKKGLLADKPEFGKANSLYETVVVAPYEASRKFINSTTDLAEDLGDTLGEKLNVGGFRYGDKAKNGLIEYVPYNQAIQDKDVYGMLSPITGKIGVKDSFNIKGLFYDPQNPDNDDHTDTAIGSFAEAGMQFLIGFKGADKILKLGKVAPATTKVGSFAQMTGKGAIADFVAFDETTGRLADVINEYAPEHAETYLGYLLSREDDTWYESRFKNALEGMGIGSLAEALFRGVRYAKNKVSKSKNEKLMKEDEAYLEKSQEVIRNLDDKLENATTISEKMKIVNDELDKGLKKEFKITKKLTKSDNIRVMNEIVSEGLESNYEKWRKGEIDSEEAFNIPATFINLDTFKPKVKVNKETGESVIEGGLSLDGVRTFKSFFDTLQKYHKKFDKTFSDEAVRKKAINDYGGDTQKVFEDFGKFADAVEDTSSLIFAHEVALTSLLNSMPKFVRQYKQGLRTQEDMNIMFFMLENMGLNAKRVRSASGRNLRVFGITKREFDQANIIENIYKDAKANYDNFGGGNKGFQRFINQIAMADNPTATRKVINFAFRNRVWDIANEVWINALLSNPKTQLINLTSNGITAILRPIEDVIGNKMSELISFRDIEKVNTFKTQREGAKIRLASLTRNLSDSFRYTYVALKNGELVLQGKDTLTKVDTAQTKATGQGLIGNLIRAPSRFLNAGDEFFKQINYRGALEEQAHLLATRQGLKGKAYKDFVDEYFKQGFDENGLRGTNEEALRYAEETTYTNELTGFSKRFQEAIIEYPILKQVFPFVRTPFQLAKAIADRTPLAGLYRTKHLLGLSGDPVMIAKARGQLAVGSILLGTAYYLASMGLISGRTGYTDEKPLNPYRDRELLRLKKTATGFKPYSIKFGDKQRSFGLLDPFGALFGMVADFHNIRDQLTEEEAERVGADLLLFALNQQDFNNPISAGTQLGILGKSTALAVQRNLLSKTYFRGISDIINAVMSEDSSKFERYVSQKMGSFVPNIVSKINSDPYYRDARGVFDQFFVNLGNPSATPPRFNSLGEPHRDKDSFGDRIFKNMFNIFGTQTLKEDKVAEEFLRLGKGIPELKYFQNNVDYSKFSNGKQSAYSRLNELLSTTTRGGKTLRQALEEEIGKERYKNLGDPVKLADQVADDGGKLQRLKVIYNLYLIRAEADFRKEANKFKFDDNNKLNLTQAIKNTKRNNLVVGQPRIDSDVNTNKLQPIYNFGNN